MKRLIVVALMMAGCADDTVDFERDYYVETDNYVGFLDPTALPELFRYEAQYRTTRVYKVNDSLVWVLTVGRRSWYDGPHHSLLSSRSAFMYLRDKVRMNESDLAALLGFDPAGDGEEGE